MQEYYVYPYRDYAGGSGLVVYKQAALSTFEHIVKTWRNHFQTCLPVKTQLIDGPCLIPYQALRSTGHIAAFQTNANQLFKTQDGRALRPETCVAIFAYYKAVYGRRPCNIAIMQEGRAFRNERTTRGIARLAEFRQLELQLFGPNSTQIEKLWIDQVTYHVTPAFAMLYRHANTFFNALNVTVVPKVVVDKPFYSRFTIDFYVGSLEVACLNDRGTNDIAQNTTVTEFSCGLNRLWQALCKAY